MPTAPKLSTPIRSAALTLWLCACALEHPAIPADRVPGAVELPAVDSQLSETDATDAHASELPPPTDSTPADLLTTEPVDVPPADLSPPTDLAPDIFDVTPPRLDVPSMDSPRPDIIAPDIPAPDIPAPDIPALDIPAPDIPAPDIPAPDIPAPDIPAPDIPAPDTGPMCPSGQSFCAGGCRATATDSAHCGACDRACAAMQSCVGGSCTNCGFAAQSCCSGNRCTPGNLCSTLVGRCVACGAAGQYCCSGACGTGLNCVSIDLVFSYCVEDRSGGQIGRRCRTGGSCDAGATCRFETLTTNGYCVRCGALDHRCCGGACSGSSCGGGFCL